MGFRFSYIILFLFIPAKLICQDVIVKKDSTKIISKLLEVNPQEIKYNRIDIPSGPIYMISKNDVAYVIYSNGIKESFYTNPTLVNKNKYLSKKDSFIKTLRVKDYIKFNVQLGAIMQSLSSNYIRRNPPQSKTSEEAYSASSNNYIYNYNIGFNFLFGKSPYIKHVIGVNYLHSTGEYDYSYSLGGYTSYDQKYHYVSKIDFINVVTGLKLKLFNKLHIEPLASINIAANSDIRFSGISTTKYIAGNGIVYKTETKYYSDEKISAEQSGLSSTISLCPKISYDFYLKRQTLGVYISYNLALRFRLPWYMAGITYYPFKKLR